MNRSQSWGRWTINVTPLAISCGLMSTSSVTSLLGFCLGHENSSFMASVSDEFSYPCTKWYLLCSLLPICSSDTEPSSLLSCANAPFFLLLQNRKWFSIKAPGYLFECFLNVQLECFLWCATRSSLWNAKQIASHPITGGQQKTKLFCVFLNAIDSLLPRFRHLMLSPSLMRQISKIQGVCCSPLNINLSPSLLKNYAQMGTSYSMHDLTHWWGESWWWKKWDNTRLWREPCNSGMSHFVDRKLFVPNPWILFFNYFSILQCCHLDHVSHLCLWECCGALR